MHREVYALLYSDKKYVARFDFVLNVCVELPFRFWFKSSVYNYITDHHPTIKIVHLGFEKRHRKEQLLPFFVFLMCKSASHLSLLQCLFCMRLITIYFCPCSPQRCFAFLCSYVAYLYELNIPIKLVRVTESVKQMFHTFCTLALTKTWFPVYPQRCPTFAAQWYYSGLQDSQSQARL